MSHNNKFEGPDAIRDYLFASMITPVVTLTAALNPFEKDGVVIQALLPSEHSIKIITAYYMLKDLQDRGLLEGKKCIVENSSGNTVMCFGLWAPYFGIEKVIALVAQDLAAGKLATLQRRSIEIRTILPDMKNGIAIAEELGKQPGHINPHQYKSESNVMAHFQHTGPLIDRLTGGKVRITSISVGTSGTIGGISKYFRQKFGREHYTSVGVICTPDAEVPGARSRERLKHISFDWESFADPNCIVEVDTLPAYYASMRLDSNGIPAGPSGGMAYWGLLKFLAAEKAAGNLDKYRDPKDGKICTVVVFPDDAKNYSDKYTTVVKLRYHSADRSIVFPLPDSK